MKYPYPALRLVGCIAAALLFSFSTVFALKADSDFENGNAIIKSVDAESGRVVIEPQTLKGSQNIWWFVRLTDVPKGKPVELVVDNLFTKGGQSNPVYSYDGKTWHRMSAKASPFRATFTEPTVWIARNIPYTYTDSLALAKDLEGKPGVTVSDLCQSEGGRPVKLLRITDETVPDAGKKIIWLMARQHAFESHSSRVADGFARWLASDAAASLRKQTITYVVPVMDADSVAEGDPGKDQQPVDFNRSWGENAHWPQVRASIDLLKGLLEGGKHQLAAFIDVHSPYYRDGNHWYIGKREPLRQNLRDFAAIYSKTLDDMQAANRWEPASRLMNPSNRGGSWATWGVGYAENHFLQNNDKALVTAIEISHWKDGARGGQGSDITVEGLNDYGRGLGRAIEAWLAQPAQ